MKDFPALLKSLNGVAIEATKSIWEPPREKEGCQASTKICNHAAAGHGMRKKSWTELAMTTFMAPTFTAFFDKEAW